MMRIYTYYRCSMSKTLLRSTKVSLPSRESQIHLIVATLRRCLAMSDRDDAAWYVDEAHHFHDADVFRSAVTQLNEKEQEDLEFLLRRGQSAGLGYY